jgi:glycosyltransferase involved in cell wall biosynthesis
MLQNAAPFSPLVSARTEGMKRWFSFRVLERMMSFSSKRSERVIFISKYFRDLFVATHRVRPEQAEVIYLGRELTESCEPDAEIVAKLRHLKPVILCISHLYPYKRLGVLITAYHLQRECLIGMGIRLRIVGKAMQRAEHDRLTSLISEYRLEGWVELSGEVPQNQVSRVLSIAAFFVFQTTCENCPSTLIEALAAGVPVASAGVGVMPEIAGDAALYFDPLDPNDLGRALVAMATDDGLRNELVLRAKEQIRQFPSWERVAISTLACLELAGRRHEKQAGVPQPCSKDA